ncbi:MAG: hypothetical protein QOF62_1098 [Pyrinomonadaceae bacterium]|jgi:hypothetical protein|nr:hypothetical protein [Pyrinomonadaceae bacterium]
MHDESPDAAGLHLNLMNRVLETVWPPPLGQVFRIGPNFPYEFARRIEETRSAYFTIGCFSHRAFLKSLSLFQNLSKLVE